MARAGRRRSRCKECGGKGICSHGRVRSQCKECRGASSGNSLKGHLKAQACRKVEANFNEGAGPSSTRPRKRDHIDSQAAEEEDVSALEGFVIRASAQTVAPEEPATTSRIRRATGTAEQQDEQALSAFSQPKKRPRVADSAFPQPKKRPQVADSTPQTTEVEQRITPVARRAGLKQQQCAVLRIHCRTTSPIADPPS